MLDVPDNPELNWAYYNMNEFTSYIWDGSSWQILATLYKDKTAPEPISNATIKSYNGAVLLNWTDPADKDLYGVIIIGTKENETVPEIITLYSMPKSSVLVSPNTESYLWTNLEENTIYTFTFYAIDSSVNKSEAFVIHGNSGSATNGHLNISITPSTTLQTKNTITATLVTETTAASIVNVKYAKDERSAKYFNDGNGTSITKKEDKYTFLISTNGTYTAYVKDSDGRKEVATIIISNIDKTSPKTISNLDVSYNSKLKTMEAFWKNSISSDVVKQTISYTTNGITKTKELLGTDNSFSFSCEGDNSEYIISIQAEDAAGNISAEVSCKANAAGTLHVTEVTLDKTRFDVEVKNQKINVAVKGHNLLMTNGKVFALQIEGENIAPVSLSVADDSNASGSISIPKKENTYTLNVVYNDEIIATSTFTILPTPEITNIIIPQDKFPYNVGGTETITIQGTSLDLCEYVKLEVSKTGTSYTATLVSNYTMKCEITIPKDENAYTIKATASNGSTVNTSIRVYGKAEITRIQNEYTTTEYCGETKNIFITGKNLDVYSEKIFLICNEKYCAITATSQTSAYAEIKIPVVTEAKTFTITATIDDTEVENLSGSLVIRK
ncbi:MAG: hypothetical protein WCQ67_01980 [Treponema sp.]